MTDAPQRPQLRYGGVSPQSSQQPRRNPYERKPQVPQALGPTRDISLPQVSHSTALARSERLAQNRATPIPNAIGA